MLRGKKILLGVTGSIAAYKSAVLTRLLTREGAEVRIIMTPSAHDFITPLTLSVLSRNEVFTRFVREGSGSWNSHVELGLWADVLLIAPASANTIAKFATGICDNLLVAVYLSARCPVIIAPAMDLDMYNHPVTAANIARLSSAGNFIIPSEYGELASGLTGVGRMAEPENIVSYLSVFLDKKNELSGKNILITAGPTREPIDPVRFISNHSTGKMGAAIAKECVARGATVDLVLGAAPVLVNNPGIRIHPVSTALEMLETSRKLYSSCSVAIFTAAVADYRPEQASKQKIKKTGDQINLELVKNPDIASELGKIKTWEQINVGFALETEHAVENATLKLQSKNLDCLVLNSLEDKGAGFGYDTNKVSILDSDGGIRHYDLKSKEDVARDIMDHLSRKYLHA